MLIPFFLVYAIESVTPPQNSNFSAANQEQDLSYDGGSKDCTDCIEILDDENAFDEYLDQNKETLEYIVDAINSLTQLGCNTNMRKYKY